MKRIFFAGFLFSLALVATSAAALVLDPLPGLVLGLALTISVTMGGDLAVTRWRRRMRSPDEAASVAQTGEVAGSPVGEAPETEPAGDEEPAAEGEPQDLWFIPRVIEPESDWCCPPVGQAEAAEERRDAPSETVASDIIGRTVGPYQVLERIGQGGMATVYRGMHPELGRDVAIKVLEPSLVGTPEMAEAFRREARTIAGLRHPNVVQVYDFGPLDRTHYLAMEFVPGSDLGVEMARRQVEQQPFTPAEILDLLGQVAAALDYAHEQGIVHRDVKPGNILLNAQKAPILSDFGLATLRRTRATLITTIGRNVLGTPEYTAPEQALDAQAAGPRSDIYSLGCILYEMVTGHLPFEAESPLSIALMHINEEPAPPRKYAPDLAPGAEAAILKALAKEPERRFATAGAMVVALEGVWADAKT